jgi:hypothetical protein
MVSFHFIIASETGKPKAGYFVISFDMQRVVVPGKLWTLSYNLPVSQIIGDRFVHPQLAHLYRRKKQTRVLRVL